MTEIESRIRRSQAEIDADRDMAAKLGITLAAFAYRVKHYGRKKAIEMGRTIRQGNNSRKYKSTSLGLEFTIDGWLKHFGYEVQKSVLSNALTKCAGDIDGAVKYLNRVGCNYENGPGYEPIVMTKKRKLVPNVTLAVGDIKKGAGIRALVGAEEQDFLQRGL